MKPTITMTHHPFNSQEAAELVALLDAELSSLYPDWDDLPHPGRNDGLEGGSCTNPVPVLVGVDGDTRRERKSDVMNRDGHGEKGEGTAEGGDEESVKLEFFIAWLEPDLTTTTTTTASLPSTGSEAKRKAIGCVALRPLPYFPSHHAPMPSQPAPPEQKFKTAELKRLYVHRSHRISSFPATTASAPTLPSPDNQVIIPISALTQQSITHTETVNQRIPKSLSTLLLSHAEDHALHNMDTAHIVLETGVRQHGAIKLYERNGYTRIPVFGDYVGAGEEEGQGGVSMCFEKWLR